MTRTLAALASLAGLSACSGESEQRTRELPAAEKVFVRADFVVLDRNLFDVSAHEINEAQVTLTVFDGRTVYEN